MKFLVQNPTDSKVNNFVNVDLATGIKMYTANTPEAHKTARLDFGNNSPAIEFPIIIYDLELDEVGARLKEYIENIPSTGLFIKVGEDEYIRKSSIVRVSWTEPENPVRSIMIETVSSEIQGLSEDGIKAVVKYLQTVGEKEGFLLQGGAYPVYLNMNNVGVGTLPVKDEGDCRLFYIGAADYTTNVASVRKIVESHKF